MPTRGKLVVLLGPVGVGKSTIIRGLTQTLKVNGLKVSTVFIKAFHGPSYVLWALMARILGIESKYAPWFMISRSGRINLAKVLATISLYLDVFFVIPLKLLKIILLRNSGYYVISEEYLYSTLFDYIYPDFDSKMRCRLTSRLTNTPIRILNTLAAKYTPDIIIILIASIPELRRRWIIRGYGDPQPRYVLAQYAFLNRFLCRFNNAITIDTTGLNVKETLTMVLKVVHGNL
jgi:energy-coupling factor transporter ATP-binding protein EcfA2